MDAESHANFDYSMSNISPVSRLLFLQSEFYLLFTSGTNIILLYGTIARIAIKDSCA